MSSQSAELCSKSPRKAAGNPGIGEEDVDAAMIGDGLLDQPLDVRLRARIDGDDVHALGAVRRDDRRAFRAEQIGASPRRCPRRRR